MFLVIYGNLSMKKKKKSKAVPVPSDEIYCKSKTIDF